MFGGFAAPARRVMLPMGDASFEKFTEAGLKLWDAAVAWATNASTTPQPKLNIPVKQGNNITLSWTGSGKLQEAAVITGPWTDTASQTNPQTVPVSGTARFYRIKQ
jgi:hypothetical protein